MSVPDTSIDPRIRECAKRAFLENGYQNTSLKDICRAAGVTTGALYKRYRGKEDLFCALTAQAVQSLDSLAALREGEDFSSFSNEELLKAWDMYDNDNRSWSMEAWFDFLYARKDEFTLLLSCAGGTRYSKFMDDWVERMTRGTFRFMGECVRRGMVEHPVGLEELRILILSFWTTISEPFLQNFTREQLDEHCRLVCRVFDWIGIFGIRLPEQ